MHRVYHDTLSTLGFVGASIATWASINGERLQIALGVILAVGSALWSFWLSMRAKRSEMERQQRWLDFEQRVHMAVAQKEAGVVVDTGENPKNQ